MRTLLLAIWAVIMFSNGATAHHGPSGSPKCYGGSCLGSSRLARGLQGGAVHQQNPNNTFDLKASIFANQATIEAFRESEVLWWVLFRLLSQSPRK